MRDVQRRSQELEIERARLHERLLATAELVRRSHQHTAETMDSLADTGPAKYAARRRRAAEWSRGRAEDEARHIAKLKGRRRAGERAEGSGPGS